MKLPPGVVLDKVSGTSETCVWTHPFTIETRQTRHPSIALQEPTGGETEEVGREQRSGTNTEVLPSNLEVRSGLEVLEDPEHRRCNASGRS